MPDFVGVEHIQLQSYSKNGMATAQVETYRVLANLQGVIFDTLFEKEFESGLVRPTEWRKYCGISTGDQHRENRKKMAQEKVAQWYGLKCTQDEADAICVGKYFVGNKVIKADLELWGD